MTGWELMRKGKNGWRAFLRKVNDVKARVAVAVVHVRLRKRLDMVFVYNMFLFTGGSGEWQEAYEVRI